MIARPVRIDTGGGKRRDVAAAWRRIEDLRARGYTVDHGGRWSYSALDDWIGASDAGYGWRREPVDGPVSYSREIALARYVATGLRHPPR